MRSLNSNKRIQLLEDGYKFGKYKEVVEKIFRENNTREWVNEYVLDDWTVIYKDMLDGNKMIYSVGYLRDKGVI